MPTIVSEPEATRLRRMMELKFERAKVRHRDRLHESFYLFGGQYVRMRIVGHGMARHVIQPFSHLRADVVEAGNPQLTVDLWDETETEVHCQVSSRNGDAARRKVTAVFSDGRFVGQQLRNVLTVYNDSTQRIISSVAWGDELSSYERWKPLARPLLEWHNSRSIQMIHAGLVSQHGQGILIVGKSGSGKSTSALACLSAGFGFLSEDYVGLQRLHDGSFVGHSLYNSVFLSRDHLARFPALIPYVMEGMPHEQKSAVVLSQVFPERLERVVPIRALVLPRIVDATESKVRPATKGETLLLLGPSSLLQIPNRRLGVRGFDKLAQLVEQVPAYWLDLGRDLDSIPRCVEELLSQIR